MSEEKPTWSTRMARLESIIGQLEKAEIDLATTLELFEEGLERDGQRDSVDKEHPVVTKAQLNKVIAIRFSSILRHHPLILWTLSAI